MTADPVAELRAEVERLTRALEEVSRERDALAEDYKSMERESGDVGSDLRELGYYAKTVAHDFNNLLVGILGNTRLALMDLSPFSPCRPLMEEAESAAMRAAKLANQMLAFSGRFVAQQDSPPLPRVEGEERWQGTGNILVVDDEETVRQLAKRVLEKFGFRVVMADSGARALEIYRAHGAEIAAVLLDMSMPELDGLATFHRLRQHDSNAKVILTSGYEAEDALAQADTEGLAGFIQKPYLPEDLISQLQVLLDPGTPPKPAGPLDPAPR